MKCVCCHDDTIERKQANCLHAIGDLSAMSPDFMHSFLVCKCCNRGQRVSCVLEFKDRIENDMPKQITESCQWYHDVSAIRFRGCITTYHISFGICCSFKSAYVGEYSVTKVHHPDEKKFITNDTANAIDDTLNSSSSSDENEQDSDRHCMSGRRQLQLEQSRVSWREHRHVPIGTLGFLSNYHADVPFRTKMLSPATMLKMMKAIMKSSQHNNTSPPQFNNRYAGALYVPSHNILIQTQAFNSVLYTDVHGLASSPVDDTPGLPHAVISEINGQHLSEYMRYHHHPAFFSRATQEMIMVDDVSSPEDQTLRRSWNVQVITLPQVHSTDEVIKRKGLNTFPREELSNALLFGFNQVNPRADLTIILGSLDINGSSTPKLILMRFHRMITSISNTAQAKSLYHTLRCVSGNRGFELNRIGGSSGLRDDQSDQDLLMVMNEIPSTLPRKCGACLIIPFGFGYKILYKKRSKKAGKHRIAICTYSVPKDGGSFTFNNSAMKSYPFLGEFTYIKMLATMILLKMNETWKESCKFEVSIGPLRNEFSNILMARNCFISSNRCYHTFISNFNNQNSASMVSYNVGLHNDTFNQRKESLENKLIVTCPGMTGFGRGGSLFRINNTALYSYAILDWTATTRSHRTFVNANRPALERAGVRGSRMTQQNIGILFRNDPPLHDALRRHEENFSASQQRKRKEQNTNTERNQTTTTTSTTQTSTSTGTTTQTGTTNRVTRQQTRTEAATRESSTETTTLTATSDRATRQQTRTEAARREQQLRENETRRRRSSNPNSPYQHPQRLRLSTDRYMTPAMHRDENRMTLAERVLYRQYVLRRNKPK